MNFLCLGDGEALGRFEHGSVTRLESYIRNGMVQLAIKTLISTLGNVIIFF